MRKSRNIERFCGNRQILELQNNLLVLGLWQLLDERSDFSDSFNVMAVPSERWRFVRGVQERELVSP
jgi:hypothetical protein